AKAPDPTMHDAIACCDGKDEGKYLLNVASGLQAVGRALQSALGDEKALRADEIKQLHEGYHLEDLVSNVHGHDRVVLYARYIATVGTILGRASRNKIDLKGIGIETETLQKNLAVAAAELAKANPDELPAIDAALVRAVLPDRTDKIEVRSSRASLLELNVSDRFMSDIHDELSLVASKLQASAGCGTQKVHTDCSLKDTISTVRPAYRQVAERPEIERMTEYAYRASEAIRRYSIDCLCAAFNPPCPPCDDPGVLLASIEVDGCTVVRICNSVREYVYAPSTLRYWGAIDHVPPSWLCCGFERRIPVHFGHEAVRREQDRMLQLRHVTEASVDSPSLRATVGPPQTARMLEHPVELELVELRKKIDALESKLLAAQPKAEKADKKGDK
ncbi:MAG TPA: hypothetical protein VLT45_15130, partial [Kofleriaceae bacterium]|nr:hypothetical protein [Kofleriaceae bacterium]